MQLVHKGSIIETDFESTASMNGLSLTPMTGCDYDENLSRSAKFEIVPQLLVLDRRKSEMHQERAAKDAPFLASDTLRKIPNLA